MLRVMTPDERVDDQLRPARVEDVDEHRLLIRHARDWAAHRSRPLDPDLLSEALRLRSHQDEMPAQAWPAGSAERLLLVTWPAYGSAQEPQAIHDTLDTFWRFLRATGRMASASAEPSTLRKESKRALPKMQAAYDDPAHHSQHRVLADFGRSMGVDLEGAADIDDVNERLQSITEAWNALPQEERVRRMPDPSPKGTKGEHLTRALNGPSSSAPAPASPAEVAAAAADAEASEFVRDCLRLVEWVGEGRQVTKAGLLRPAVAREAYQHLDLWPWERGLEAIRWEEYRGEEMADREVDALRADLALRSWHSAGDCFPLDRLWYAIDAATLIEIGSTRARRNVELPLDEEDLARTGLGLALALAMRSEPLLADSLAMVLTRTVPGGESLETLRQAWRERLEPSLADVLGSYHARSFEEMLYVFGDTGLWHVEADRLTLTTLGEMFVDPFWDAVGEGMIHVD